MNKSLKLSKNIIIYGLSNGLKSLVPFIMLPILTNYISAEGYGILSIIETSILFVAPFILLNIESSLAVEYYKVEKKELSIFLTNGLFTSFIAFLIVLIIFYFSNDFLTTTLSVPSSLILLIPLFVFLRLIPTVILVLYQTQQKPLKYLYFNIVQTITDFSLSALFIIIIKYGYTGRIIGTYLAFFIFTIIGIILIHKEGYFSFIFSKKQIKQFLNFGLPLIPHTIGGTIIILSSRYFISYFKGNEAVGLYSVAYQASALMLLFSRSVNQAWSPMLFSLLQQNKKDQATKYTFILFVVFIFVSIFVFLLSDLIFDLLIDKSYEEAKVFFPLLLLGFLFQSLYFLYTNYFFYNKKTKVLATITFTGALINLALNYILIQKAGTIGIAYSTAITWFIFFAAVFFVYKFKISKYAETN